MVDKYNVDGKDFYVSKEIPRAVYKNYKVAENLLLMNSLNYYLYENGKDVNDFETRIEVKNLTEMDVVMIVAIANERRFF